MARVLAVDITKRTKEFPADEKFSMVSQMRRAALSGLLILQKGPAEVQQRTRHILAPWLTAV